MRRCGPGLHHSHVRSCDFVAACSADAASLRFLSVIDEHTRALLGSDEAGDWHPGAIAHPAGRSAAHGGSGIFRPTQPGFVPDSTQDGRPVSNPMQLPRNEPAAAGCRIECVNGETHRGFARRIGRAVRSRPVKPGCVVRMASGQPARRVRLTTLSELHQFATRPLQTPMDIRIQAPTTPKS